MIPRKATSVVFLAFSVLVAFKHYLNDEYEYIILTIPFFASVISYCKISRLFEIAGLLIASIYIMAFQVFHVGMILSIISSIFFFTLGVKLRTARIYIWFTIPVVFLCSYFQYIQSENMLLRASFDALLYGVISFVVYVALQEYISYNIDKAIRIAKEAIDIAKKGI